MNSDRIKEIHIEVIDLIEKHWEKGFDDTETYYQLLRDLTDCIHYIYHFTKEAELLAAGESIHGIDGVNHPIATVYKRHYLEVRMEQAGATFGTPLAFCVNFGK